MEIIVFSKDNIVKYVFEDLLNFKNEKEQMIREIV